jgi:hypothetical protein
MVEGKVSEQVARDAAAVWAVVGQFGGIDAWLPSVESCAVDGDSRTVHSLGMVFREQLVDRDDEAMRISYKIVESPLPLEHHRATIAVVPTAVGAVVSWTFEVRPDALQSPFEDNYRAGLSALKDHLEG